MSGVDLITRFLSAYKFTVPFDQVRDAAGFSSLYSLGLIEKRESGTGFLCDACDFPHAVKIGIDPVAEKLGWRCPEIGFVPATAEHLKSVRFSPEALAARISDALQCRRRRKTVMIENLLWEIGHFDFQDHDVNVYLASRIRDAEDASEIAGALQAVPSLRNGLVITPDISGTAGLTIAGCHFAEIGEVISISTEGLECDQPRVVRRAGIMMKAGPGRFLHKARGEVADMIQRVHEDGRTFRSKRAASTAIQDALKLKFPDQKPPGRTVIEEEIDTSEVGCFLVGK